MAPSKQSVRTTTLAVVASLAALAAASACRSGAMFQEQPIEQPVPTASGPPPPLTDDPHAAVEQLYVDLVSRRTTLALPAPKLSPDDTCEPVCKLDDPPGLPSKGADCAAAAGSACAATCAQADGACDDAAKICVIAKQARTEALLASRCREASATCRDAGPACCNCK
jgi:hypothetical protein